MEAFVRFLDDKTVQVQTHSEAKDGSAAGEVRRELRAGDSVWGYSPRIALSYYLTVSETGEIVHSNPPMTKMGSPA